MAKYIIVKKDSKQYKLVEGKEFLIDHFSDDKPELTPIFYSDGQNIIVDDNLSKIKLDYKIVSQLEKGDKLKIFKYKSKSRYRKSKGFRASYTKILLNKISIS